MWYTNVGVKLKSINESIQPGMSIHSYVDGARKQYGKVGTALGEGAYQLEENTSFCTLEFCCFEGSKDLHMLFCAYTQGNHRDKVREIDAGLVVDVKKDGDELSLKVLDMVDTKGRKYYQTYQFNLYK